ncbi:hypothetical protein A3Q56_01861 [Intoshia linei]|uniref:Uncharacterized protein n=1 Tax=Intoshia linei TaxID=1819745 RepID=A0A177B7W1_9BILA|nr:hypothetical protein A3Q56_01861 [Intoshia linei]
MSDAGSVECIPCPMGYECTGLSNVATKPCLPTHYSDLATLTCAICEAGNYCDGSQMVSCPSGTFSIQGSVSCTVCSIGNSCTSTNVLNCAKGYSTYGHDMCIRCNDGFTCSPDWSSIKRCDPGTYNVDSKSTCTICPAGSYCPIPSGKPIICTNGFYSSAGQSQCTACPLGYECIGIEQTATTKQCDLGDYASFLATTKCIICPEGYYCPYRHQDPIKCPEKHYSAARKSFCTLCEAGYACPSNKVTHRYRCPQGSYSMPGWKTCKPCTSGYLCDIMSSSPTPTGRLCAKGGWCDGIEFIQCEPGTYNPNEGSVTDKDCILCPAGYCCQIKGIFDYTSYECPLGYFCLMGTTDCLNYPCPAGTYGSSKKLKKNGDCFPCPDGKYCTAGTTTPLDCPKGFYCPPDQQSAIYLCPPGTYNGFVSKKLISHCLSCPIGNYCPTGTKESPSITPIPCPIGTYNLETGHDGLISCLPCKEGYACQTAGLGSLVDLCAKGYYCSEGSKITTASGCPGGTYGSTTGLTRSADCTKCPAGKFCPHCSSSCSDPINCYVGYYCPEMTSQGKRYACPPGTYGKTESLTAETECTPCPVGSYCSGFGEVTVSGLCDPGHYCLINSSKSNQYPCPEGTYRTAAGAKKLLDCITCEKGFYCPIKSKNMQPCTEGTYNLLTGKKTLKDCLECPAGSSCLLTTVAPADCNTGFYSIQKSKTCSKCLAGYFCNQATTSYATMMSSVCPAGFICPEGSADSTTKAPVGTYAPKGSATAISCPPGTFNINLQGDSINSCSICTAGKYCNTKSSVESGKCEAGYYCPNDLYNVHGNPLTTIGSYGSKQIPCPSGYYSAAGADALLKCLDCPAGKYCGLATATPLTCPIGHYCLINSSTPLKCPVGTINSATGKGSLTDCIDCSAGKYCDTAGLSTITGSCSAGYICTQKSTIPNPHDKIVGSQCDQGNVCPVGTTVQVPCAAGYYNSELGLDGTLTTCKKCPAGFYCSGTGNKKPTGICDSGYYCPIESIVKTQNIVLKGYFSKSAAQVATKCIFGKYNKLDGQSSCLVCDVGYYCPNMGTSVQTVCPVGFYCTSGSSTPIGCPTGTFLDVTSKGLLTDCKSCNGGKYCQIRGQSAITGDCKAGFYCTSKAESADPTKNLINAVNGKKIVNYGDICTAGHYCPTATSTPIECPTGTYNPSTGGLSLSEACKSCDPGKYCSGTKLTTVTGDCKKGYYCIGKATQSDPIDGVTGNICPINAYCPAGCIEPILCEYGYYTDSTGSFECKLCTSGKICKQGVNPTNCRAGYYCPASTTLNPIIHEIPCPEGTYNSLTGKSALADCKACDGGKYCEGVAKSAITGSVRAGYWSVSGATNETPNDVTNIRGKCQRGYYCQIGASTQTKCPSGTFGPNEYATSVNECPYCTCGYACPTAGMTSKGTTKCSAGYYCQGKTTNTTPSSGKCSPGHYCPSGSCLEIKCPEGKYQDLEAQALCKPCTAGNFCPLGSTSQGVCPKGHYCPVETSDYNNFPCPLGTFRNLVQGKTIGDCLACTAGSYCSLTGLIAVEGQCDGGYYCGGNAKSSSPVTDTLNGHCLSGQVCPPGSTAPVNCPAGKYCNEKRLSIPSGDCYAGYICLSKATIPNPTDGTTGKICPVGKYCVSGATIPVDCPEGTYRDVAGAGKITDCYDCTMGYYCSGTANINVVGECKAGYYCMGKSKKIDQVACITGHYCPQKSLKAIPCLAGTFAKNTGQATCDVCTLGFYCPHKCSTPIVCPTGSYCPAGTKFATENLCPFGTFMDITGGQKLADCKTCTSGYYCSDLLSIAVTAKCAAGYYCTSGAKSATPNQDLNSNACPKGKYCVLGTETPVDCPIGTFSNSLNLVDSTECTPCLLGMYCATAGLILPTGKCDSGFFCQTGSKIKNPSTSKCPAKYYCQVGAKHPIPCPSGNFCPEGSATPTPCTAGNYCATDLLFAVSGKCNAGFTCTVSSITPRPVGLGGY